MDQILNINNRSAIATNKNTIIRPMTIEEPLPNPKRKSTRKPHLNKKSRPNNTSPKKSKSSPNLLNTFQLQQYELIPKTLTMN